MGNHNKVRIIVFIFLSVELRDDAESIMLQQHVSITTNPKSSFNATYYGNRSVPCSDPDLLLHVHNYYQLEKKFSRSKGTLEKPFNTDVYRHLI